MITGDWIPLLIDTTDVDASVNPAGDASYEPAFFVPFTGDLQLDADASGRNGAYLSHRVARCPSDLTAHVLRVYLHGRSFDSDALWGALIDLFLVLKREGTALKHRLLELSRSVLSTDRYRFLAARVSDGLDYDAECPQTPFSVLSRGRSGMATMIRKLDEYDAQQDVLATARAHIEYGQVEQAQELLEGALRAGPGREDLHRELLDIYRGTRDIEAFRDMFAAVAFEDNPVPELWEEVARFLVGNTQHD